MPRPKRVWPAGEVFHVLNRAVARLTIFEKPEDYDAFLRVSIIGRYKNMQGETGQFGVTSMLLSIGAFVGKLTIGGIRKALETITSPQLKSWERSALGATIQSQRKRAFSTSQPGTKPVPTASPSIA